MKQYLLERKTVLHASIGTAWHFFSDPHNLAKITPANMGFKVISSDLPNQIQSGLLIAYTVSPLLGFPLHWITEIKEVEPGRFFADEQRKGPYRYWRHEHFFTLQKDNTVLMEDKVYYSLPLGWLGRLFALHIVKTKLERIFDFRSEAIEKIFPGSKPA